MGEEGFTIGIRQVNGFAFEVDFGMEGVGNLLLDEPEPIGGSTGPNPSRVFAASVGTCLSASLLFCLQKARTEVKGIETRVKAEMARNEQGRLRIGGIRVEITVDPGENGSKGIDRCTQIFRDYCVVTESVENGVPVDVEVRQAGAD